MFRCDRSQIELQIQKISIVNFKIGNAQKFQPILSGFLGIAFAADRFGLRFIFRPILCWYKNSPQSRLMQID